MKVVKCETCQALLMTLDEGSSALHVQHLMGLVYMSETHGVMEVSLRCRHCQRVTVVPLSLEASPAVAAGP